MSDTRNPNYLDRVVDREVARLWFRHLLCSSKGCGKTWTSQSVTNSEVFLDGSEALRIAAS